MYVCICNAIRETELRKAAIEVVGTAEEVYLALNKTPLCRQCLDEAEVILADQRQAQNVPACLSH